MSKYQKCRDVCEACHNENKNPCDFVFISTSVSGGARNCPPMFKRQKIESYPPSWCPWRLELVVLKDVDFDHPKKAI